MIGPRVVTFECSAGLSYYALRGLSERVEAAIRDYFNQPDRRQIDIEEIVKPERQSVAA